MVGDTRFPAHPPCLDGRHLHGMPRELPQMWGLVGPGVTSYQCAQYLPCIAQPIMWESVRVPMGIGISTAQGDVTGV